MRCQLAVKYAYISGGSRVLQTHVWESKKAVIIREITTR